MLNQADLAKIVAQASTISERLRDGIYVIDLFPKTEPEFLDQVLENWCQRVAQGDWEKFQKRLHWQGWTLDQVRPFLGRVCLSQSQALPDWAKTLREIMQATAASGAIENQATLNHHAGRDPQAFEDILQPTTGLARQKLLAYLHSHPVVENERSPSAMEDLPLGLLSSEAYLTLEHSLLQKLAGICEQALENEFSHFRPLGHNLLTRLVGKTSNIAQNVYYHQFVEKLLQNGLLNFFQTYPVLGRLVAIAVDFWVENTAEFIQRLNQDWSAIQNQFNLPSPSQVVAVSPSLSDPHQRGHSAIALTFASGNKLIYKPKDLGIEAAFGEFLTWCNQQASLLEFKVLKVLNQGTYGWVEAVEHLPCQNETEAKRFYERAGMLLCLLYTFGGIDFHCENLIASGEYPMLIDLETLMHPDAQAMGNLESVTDVALTMSQQLWDSCLRTGMLPRWNLSQNERVAFDVSALGNIEPQQAPSSVRRWKSINTDDMHLVYESIPMPSRQNTVILNGKLLSPNDYLDEIVAGFERMYGFLMEQRKFLLTTNSILTNFKSQRLRFLFRATHIYNAILQKTLAPKFLTNGVDHSIALDVLSCAFLNADEKPNTWAIAQAESTAIAQLDIPYFGLLADSDVLTIGLEQPLAKCFPASCYSQILSRLKKLNHTDLDQQVAIIRGALYARVGRSATAPQSLVTPHIAANNTEISPIPLLTNEQLLHHTEAIATEIIQRAIRGTDTSVNWLGLGYIQNAERLQLQPLGENLYDGSGGVAIFLAALASVNGSSQCQEIALGAILSIRKLLQVSHQDTRSRFAQRLGIGGGTGLGSLIYILVKVSQFLQEPALLEDAQQIADLISPELLDHDQQLDIMAGAAGTILGLLALYRQKKELKVLNKAILCGEHLLNHSIFIDHGIRAWKTFALKPLTGFSHGAAGITYALLQLYGVTQNQAYLNAALEGIAYERSVFSSEVCNWPDFRSVAQGQPRFMVSWCHGAPGIGLARLGSLSIYETDEILQDVTAALQTTQRYGLQEPVDHLCCGNFGHLETLLVAAERLSQQSLQEIVHQQASRLVIQKQQTGAYALFPNLPNTVFHPGFFQGTSGIGYQLLRLISPQKFPSVLLWD
ncbi:lanthionine synthetase C family protein [Cylindrospermum sp. NIES-4074]|nr:lanthionine synthetase C family protein [Cylindrospermum sp. NIES-4074]